MEFLNNIIAQANKVGDTAENFGECVGLWEVWTDHLGAPHIWGNAIDIPENAPRDSYDVNYNTPDGIHWDVRPVPGDAVIFKANYKGTLGTGPAGHIAIFLDGDLNGYFRTFDQNFPTGTRPHIQNHITYGVAALVHPHALNPKPTPIVDVPAPVAEPAPVTPDPVVSTPSPQPVETPIPVLPPVAVPISVPQPTPQTLGTATLGGIAIVRDLDIGRDIAKVNPQVLTIASSKEVDGVIYLVTKTMADSGLNHGIASKYFVHKVDTISAPSTEEVPLHFGQEMKAELNRLEKFLTKIIHRS